jgi:methyl-accepting chemotaxis protein
MTWFNNLSISKKLTVGFFSLTAIIAIVSLLTVARVTDSAAVTQRIGDLRVPTSQASLNMVNGINHALAALRGWMLLGADPFKTERATAWREEIHAPLEQMKKFSKNWTNPENIKDLRRIEELLRQFERYQQEIEDIAQTRGNIPALEMLFSQAAPKASIMSKNITLMIDLEAKLTATPERKALLGMMADVRGTLGLSLANIRAFILSGEESFQEKFNTLWKKNSRRYRDLTNNRYLLSSNQKSAFMAFAQARKAFDPLPPKMFEMRSKPDWNTGYYWLKTKAAPVGKELGKILRNMVANQKMLLEKDIKGINDSAQNLIYLEWTLLAIGLVLASLLTILLNKTIVGPIESAVDTTVRIASGDFSFRIKTNSTDETGKLLTAMDTMVVALQKTFFKISDRAYPVAAG